MLRTSISALVAVCFLLLSAAHRIEINPGEKECFHEILQPQDRMTVTYEVGAGGQLDIDFYVVEPGGMSIYSNHKQPQGTFSMSAERAGQYTYCFSNEMASYGKKTVSFNVHGVLYVENDEQTLPVEQEIRDLSTGLQFVKDEQAYLVVRERVHRNTAESTNSRVKWWAIVQTIILLSICAVNVHVLKSWFEVKRVL